MPVALTSEQVWQEIGKQIFAVLGTATPGHEPRTVGVVYVVRERCVYICTGRSSWKVRNILAHPSVSLTVTIPKRVPWMPWIRIPPATITFQGRASVHDATEIPTEIQKALMGGLEVSPDVVSAICFIKVCPKGRFLTYGVGIPLRQMREPERARGHAPV